MAVWRQMSGWQKAILWIALLVCIWRYLQVPAVFDALLNFAAAGEIPGTDITLSADAVLWAVLGISSFGAAAIFIWLFVLRPVRHFYRLEQRPKRLASPTVVAAPPVAVRQYRLQLFTRAKVRKLQNRLLVVGQWLLPRLRRGARLSYAFTRWLAVMGKVIALELWATARPYAERFDAWLRRTLNAYGPTAAVLKALRTAIATVQDVAHRLSELSQRQRTSR